MITELHCHTTASDGLHSPHEVVRLAKLRSVAWLAITDHDTTAANDEASAAGRELGLRVIPGIEVSSVGPAGGEVHVLGYGVVPSDNATRTTLASLRGIRVARAQSILARLDALGIHIPFSRVQALAGDGIIGRPHVARALVEAGIVPHQQAAFDEYLTEGKPAFVVHKSFTPTQAVHFIHAAHGVAVLAHPTFYRGDLDALVQDMHSVGLDGIETYYPAHTAEQIGRYERLARQHNLVCTGGSDFHAAHADRELSFGSVHVPDACLAELDARMRARK